MFGHWNYTRDPVLSVESDNVECLDPSNVIINIKLTDVADLQLSETALKDINLFIMGTTTIKVMSENMPVFTDTITKQDRLTFDNNTYENIPLLTKSSYNMMKEICDTITKSGKTYYIKVYLVFGEMREYPIAKDIIPNIHLSSSNPTSNIRVFPDSIDFSPELTYH